MIRTLLIDNHDSFTWNLVHDLTRVNGVAPVVVPNDWDQWAVQGPDLLDTFDNVVISPGPGTPLNPADVGIAPEVVTAAVERDTPVLGICLGHQLIAHMYGGTVGPALEPIHGRLSQVTHSGRGVFAGIPEPCDVVRYHSLAVSDVPSAVTVDARSEDGTIMGLSVPGKLLWGVQFHPESVKTRHGPELLANFAEITRDSGRVRHVRNHVVPLQGVDDTRAFAEPLFRALYEDAEHAVWLDGNRAGDGRARFTVMGAADGRNAGPSAAVATADVAAGTVTVTRGGDGEGGEDGHDTEVIEQDVLTWLKDDLARWNIRGGGLDDDLVDVRDGEPPFAFQLGWVGYLGYGVKAQCSQGEGAANSVPSPVPDAGFVFLDRAVVIDHRYGEAHLLYLDKPRERGAGPWATAAETAWREKTAALIRQLCTDDSRDPAEAVPDPRPALHVAMHERDTYTDKVRRVHELIRQGETYEACLTTTLEAEPASGVDVPDTLDLYHRLRRDNPAPFASYLRLPGATVMSTSPERFLRVDASGTVTSSPIKGTRPVGDTEEADLRIRAELQASEKDRAENLMIVDLVRHDLGRVAAPGTVQVPELFSVESYATVHQLVSTVTATLDEGLTGVDAVRAAFPPGSMTGAPKERTMRLLEELEDGPRGVYSGAIGYFSLDGAVDLSVVIRTLVAETGADTSAETSAGAGGTGDAPRFTYGVGGAVVIQSDPDAEYDETVVKATPVLRLQ
ncbi:MAG TPA: aminodeoxychorismate synthase component I [Candidatus Corynebacterium avicola]|uniref:aminodeoxychorismate synthase n=1 Tax=Candidatus Corynebacterium avicola TaxID=2838527 RepID=A0A9D1RMG5_9CORY|nr:aminodeoxychorismate synthase component I [Candidatus Corynebacterium avicola]